MCVCVMCVHLWIQASRYLTNSATRATSAARHFGNSCNLSNAPLRRLTTVAARLFRQPVQLQQRTTSATRATSVARRFGDPCDLMRACSCNFVHFTMVQKSGILRKSHLFLIPCSLALHGGGMFVNFTFITIRVLSN